MIGSLSKIILPYFGRFSDYVMAGQYLMIMQLELAGGDKGDNLFQIQNRLGGRPAYLATQLGYSDQTSDTIKRKITDKNGILRQLERAD